MKSLGSLIPFDTHVVISNCQGSLSAIQDFNKKSDIAYLERKKSNMRHRIG
jgi:hypothetical protein